MDPGMQSTILWDSCRFLSPTFASWMRSESSANTLLSGQPSFGSTLSLRISLMVLKQGLFRFENTRLSEFDRRLRKVCSEVRLHCRVS